MLNVENASTAFVEKHLLYMSRADWGLVSAGRLTPRFCGTEENSRTDQSEFTTGFRYTGSKDMTEQCGRETGSLSQDLQRRVIPGES